MCVTGTSIWSWSSALAVSSLTVSLSGSADAAWGRRKWVGLPLGGWVYLKMGYPIPSIGFIDDSHYPYLYGHLGMQPILRHTRLMNMVTFLLSEVCSTILMLLSSHQLDVADFLGTAPFEANPSQPKFSRNPTLDFPKHLPARCSLCPGFWSILVIFKHALSPLNYLSIYLSVYLSICLSFYLSIFLSIYLSNPI